MGSLITGCTILSKYIWNTIALWLYSSKIRTKTALLIPHWFLSTAHDKSKKPVNTYTVFILKMHEDIEISL